MRIYASYLKMLRREGIQRRIFDEVKRVRTFRLDNQ